MRLTRSRPCAFKDRGTSRKGWERSPVQGPQRCWALPNGLARPYFEDLILYLEERDSLSEAKIFAAQLPLAWSLGQFQSHLQTCPEAELALLSGGKELAGDSVGLGGRELKHHRRGTGQRNATWPGVSDFTSLSLFPHLENKCNKSS